MTTLSTQLRSNSIRAAHGGLRLRARRGLRLQRRPVRVRENHVQRYGLRECAAGAIRIATQRPRPTPPLRGFLPLYRH